jgi:hypothetical protein
MLEKSLWNMRNEELISLMRKYDLPYNGEEFDRKDAIKRLESCDAVPKDLLVSENTPDGPVLTPVKPKRKYVDIIFNDQEEEGKYRFFGLNGKFYYLPVRCKCRIPEELFVGAIECCVGEKSVLTEVDGKKGYRDIKVPRFSYLVVGRGEK